MTRAAPRESASIPAAAELLSGWIGLDVETIGPASIGRAVRARMEALGLDDPADAVARARLDAAERDRLVEEVVVAESWFFRDPQVFTFVSRFVTARTALPNPQPLRILSAPCAGGEEPYSMAMALLESGLPADRFAIDAIDVSHGALERARQGRYSANAFRNADVSFRERWFRHEGPASVLDDVVRRQVRFRWANLLDDSFVAEALPPDSTPFDVVFCRNLLIYLTPEARGRVERALERLVAPDGLLVLGAAEPPILKGDWIPAGDSSVFAMRRGVRAAPAPAPTAVVAPARAAREPRRAARGKPAPVATATAAAGTTTPPAASDALPSLDEVLREAGVLANARRFAEAIARCEAHARQAGPSAQLFFLLGMLHQSAGDLDRAEGCFHKTLYLDAGHDEALLALALVAAQRGDAPMAEHYRQSAARIHARKGST